MTRAMTQLLLVGVALLLTIAAQAAKTPVGMEPIPGGVPSLSDVNFGALDAKPATPEKAWGRDPFLPPPKSGGDEGPLELTAVILGNGRGVAIINKRIYRVGDLVSGRVIERILQDRVILSDANGTIELRVQSLSDERLDGMGRTRGKVEQSGKASGGK